MRVEILALGEQIVSRELLRFGQRAVDARESLEDVATIMREATERQFESQGAYASGGWPALAASTVRRKANEGLDPRILHATGLLRESLTRKFGRGHIERVTSNALHFGTRVPYAIYHQSSRPRTKIPYRPPVGLTEGDKRRIVRTLQRSIVKGTRA